MSRRYRGRLPSQVESKSLLAVASKYPSFPILLETMRECLQDVFDVPGLVELMAPQLGLPLEARRPDALSDLDNATAARLTLSYGLALEE